LIASDPVLCLAGHIQNYGWFKTKRVTGPVYDETDFENINLWLLTHNHEDHIDQFGLKVIAGDATVVAHTSLKKILSRTRLRDIRFLSTPETTSYMSGETTISITAIPAIHARTKLLGTFIGNGNGYVLKIEKNMKNYVVYVTGDSLFNESVLEYLPGSPLDLVIANAGAAHIDRFALSRLVGRITNNNDDIRKMAEVLKPRMLIPVHWETFTHYYESVTDDSFSCFDMVKIPDRGKMMRLLACEASTDSR
ncbi:MAG TPA: MBL fold metallo-hydrolase, partial [Spirochaetota bacterium]